MQVNPFWVLKIRIATQPRVVSVSDKHARPAAAGGGGGSGGMIDTARRIVRDEGLAALWDGTSASLLGTSEVLVHAQISVSLLTLCLIC